MNLYSTSASTLHPSSLSNPTIAQLFPYYVILLYFKCDSPHLGDDSSSMSDDPLEEEAPVPLPEEEEEE